MFQRKYIVIVRTGKGERGSRTNTGKSASGHSAGDRQ